MQATTELAAVVHRVGPGNLNVSRTPKAGIGALFLPLSWV